MLVVRKPTAEPEYTPVMGASVLFRPIDRPMMRRARRAAVKVIGGEAAPESDASAAAQMEELGDALSYALLTEGIEAWRDVAIDVVEDGVTTASVLDCTAENIALVLSDPIIFDAFDAAYVVPFVMRERERAAPGNVSAASPNGTGEAATQDSAIATSPAQPKAAAGAKNAPTSSRKRKRTPKRASGASSGTATAS